MRFIFSIISREYTALKFITNLHNRIIIRIKAVINFYSIVKITGGIKYRLLFLLPNILFVKDEKPYCAYYYRKKCRHHNIKNSVLKLHIRQHNRLPRGERVDYALQHHPECPADVLRVSHWSHHLHSLIGHLHILYHFRFIQL